jgi:hypothetical protein
MATPTHYEGNVLLFTGGQTLTGPYGAPTSGAIGRMTIDFAATDDATITDGASGKSSASRAAPRRPGTVAISAPRLRTMTSGPLRRRA